MNGVICRCGRRALSHAATPDEARAAFEQAGWLFTEGRDPSEPSRMSERATCPACAARLRASVRQARLRHIANKEAF